MTSEFLATLRDPRRLAIRVQLTLLTGLLIAVIAGFMFVFFPARIAQQALASSARKRRNRLCVSGTLSSCYRPTRR